MKLDWVSEIRERRGCKDLDEDNCVDNLLIDLGQSVFLIPTKDTNVLLSMQKIT